jgi:signal transduction histidine kinase
MDADVSPQLLRAVLASSLTNIYAANALRHPQTGQIVDFQIIVANPTFQQSSGYPGHHLRSHTLLTLYPELARSALLARMVAVVETGEPFRGEEYFPNRSSSLWYDLSLSRFEQGLVVNFVDTTAQHRLQQQLEQQAQLLQATLDGAISSILSLTALRNAEGAIVDFRMEKANRAVERSLFMTPAQIEGRQLLEVFPGHVANGFFALYVQVAQTGIPRQATQQYSDAHGLDGWFAVSVVRQSADKLVVTFSNITESKQLEQQLRESNASLQQFAAVASHDLQEPLRKIQSFTQLVSDQYGPVLGEGALYLSRIKAAASRMQRLITDLLAYSQLTHQTSPAHQRLDLTSLVREVLTDLELTIQEKGAVIELDPLCELRGNPVQLRQVMQNLLANALKFTKPGQAPRIQVRYAQTRRAALPVELRLLTRGVDAYHQITVADQGIGFSEAYREQIFDAFQRLHGPGSPYSGSGLGLAIVRQVMQQHQGGVTVSSREGEGTSFFLYFPASPS